MVRTLRLAALVALILAATALAPAAHAGNFVGDDAYTLAEGESSDDNLYAFGNTVLILGTVEGDLISAGSIVTVGPTGEVTGDVWAAGSEVLIEGTVGGDVRGAGFAVQIAQGASVGGEVLGAGFSVMIEEGASADGDFTAVGSLVALDGNVGGDARVSANNVRLAGRIGGDAQLEVEPDGGSAQAFTFPGWQMPEIPQMESGLEVRDTASIGGDLNVTYVTGDAPEVDESLVTGATVIEQALRAPQEREPAAHPLVSYGAGVLSHFFGLLLIGVMGIWLAPRVMERVEANLAAAPLPAAGWGCLTVLLVPVAIAVLAAVTIFLMIILGFLPFDRAPIFWMSGLVGSMLLFGSLLAIWIGRAVAGLWLGRRILGAGVGRGEKPLWPLVLGCLLVAVIAEIPGVGGLVGWLIGVVGLGAMVITAQKRNRTPYDRSAPYDGSAPYDAPVTPAA